MATKNHVDSSVAERRLRPIYNWLDDGNNKKALQEAEKVLKKQPNFQCAKVLKALALLRLGKENECQQLLDLVQTDLQCDDPTLQAMTICYREMNKPEVICDVYLSATKKEPKNEELLTHLFMAYVRVCDYKKQQQTAMTLYKLKYKNHYYFWTVMSIVMQAHEAGPELAKNLQLPLAEKMVKKFVDENKIEAEQEVQLYLLILEMQNKLEEALSVVEGPLGDMLLSYIAVPTKRIELLVKLQSWKRANVEIKLLLETDTDNWSLYLDYFKTVFHLLDSNAVENGVAADNVIHECVKFLTSIQTNNQNAHPRLRGPYLAIMEFFIQLKKHDIDPEMHFGYFTDLLLVYFQEFGSKPCCLNDLKPYLAELSESQVTTFLDEIWKFIELEDGQLPTSKEQMLRYISNLHITRYLGFHEKLNSTAKVQLANCLLRYYFHGDQFNNLPQLPTDIRHNDPFVILIVEIMNDIWLETEDAVYLKKAILILEHAFYKSPSNHQFKILLVKLYNSLGLSKAAHKIYEQLDVKHVQLDSMGHVQCWSLISTGQYFLASHLFEITLKFFTSNYKDGADHLTFLYKFGSFLKINEFIEFRERLNDSLHYSAVTVERMLLDIIQCPSYQSTAQTIEQMCIVPEKESIEFDKLEDNRDLDLCWTSDPMERQLNAELVRSSFQHDIELLRIRALILRSIAGVVQFSTKNNIQENGNNLNNVTDPVETLSNLAQQIKTFGVQMNEKKFTRLPKNIINAPVPSRLFYLLELPYLELVQNLISSVILVGRRGNEKMKNCVEDCENPVLKLVEAISKFQTECKSTDLTQWSVRSRLLNILTLLVEMVSLVCLLCGALRDIVKPRTSQPSKKSKKKKDTAVSAEIVKRPEDQSVYTDHVRYVLALSTSAVKDLEESVGLVKDIWVKDSDEDYLAELLASLHLGNISVSELSLLNKNATDSYRLSLFEIQDVLKMKHQFLSELKL